jgi:peptidoglycan/xylan/chitin deacetylase (PgdA/CDA1 family)
MNRFGLEKKFLSWMYSKFPVIYKMEDKSGVTLTFDDGPEPGLTEKILSVCQEYRVQAYFFILFEKVKHYLFPIEIYQQHDQIMGWHGIDHFPVNVSFTPVKWLEAIKNISDIHPIEFLRPPYGLFNRRYIRWAQDNSFKIMMWTITSYDYRFEKPKKWAEQIVEICAPGDIILLHDAEKTKNFHPDGLLYLLDALQEKHLL